MLFKTIALTLATLFIAAVQVSTADAGCGSHGRLYQSKVSKSYALKQQRARKAHAVAAAKPRKSAQQARIEKPVSTPVKEAAAVTAPASVGETASNTDVNVAAIKNTCTKFVAETGTTVTVECAQQ